MHTLTVRLRPEVDASLRELAESSGRSKSWLVNEAVRRMAHDERIERERWSDTLAALEAVRRGDVVPSEDVHSWLRGWGTSDEDPIDDSAS